MDGEGTTINELVRITVTDDGEPGDEVYLVHPDGTRTLIPESGGEPDWPKFVNLDGTMTETITLFLREPG